MTLPRTAPRLGPRRAPQRRALAAASCSWEVLGDDEAWESIDDTTRLCSGCTASAAEDSGPTTTFEAVCPNGPTPFISSFFIDPEGEQTFFAISNPSATETLHLGRDFARPMCSNGCNAEPNPATFE